MDKKKNKKKQDNYDEDMELFLMDELLDEEEQWDSQGGGCLSSLAVFLVLPTIVMIGIEFIKLQV